MGVVSVMVVSGAPSVNSLPLSLLTPSPSLVGVVSLSGSSSVGVASVGVASVGVVSLVSGGFSSSFEGFCVGRSCEEDSMAFGSKHLYK